MTFEALVLGVGDAFSVRRAPASLVLRYDGFHLAVDCPDRYRATLLGAASRAGLTLDVDAIDHVLLTHLHGDHVNGLEALAFYRHLLLGRRTTLVGSPEVRADLWPRRLACAMERLWDGHRFVSRTFDDYFRFVELPWDRPRPVGPFEVRTYRTRHHVPTSALLIRAGSRSLAYSCDTSFDPDLLAFLSSADVILHETGSGPAHTPLHELDALPASLRDRMLLMHIPDELTAGSSSIPLARGGSLLSI